MDGKDYESINAINSDLVGERFDTSASYRCMTIFLIDSTSTMFEPYLDDRTKTPFSEVIKCANIVLQDMVIASGDSDYLGLVLFGTQITCNALHDKIPTETMEHISVYQELQPPHVERMKELQSLLENENLVKHKEKYGHSNSFSLASGLHVCHDILDRPSLKQATKRIYIFTCNDNPHAPGSSEREATFFRLEQVRGSNIEVLPVYLHPPQGSFNPNNFYARMELAADDSHYNYNSDFSDEKWMKDGTRRFELMCSRVLMKSYNKRSINALRWSLGPEKEISVKMFPFVRQICKPKSGLITKTAAQDVSSKTHYVVDDEQEETDEGIVSLEPLPPHDLMYRVNYCGKYAYIDPEEKQNLTNFGPSGLSLIGFKPLSSLKMHCLFTKHGAHLYPEGTFLY